MNSFSAPDVSPDGTWLTFSSSWDPSTQEDLFIMRTDGSGLLRLTDDAARERFPRFTADGKRIVFGSTRSGSWEIWSIATDGSNLTHLAGAPGKAPALPGVPSPVDARIAVWVIGGQSFIFDARRPLASQTPELIARPERPGVSFFLHRWTPDGRALFGCLADASDTVRGQVLYDVATRRFRELWPDGEGALLRDGRRIVMRDVSGRLRLADTVSRRVETLLDPAPDAVFPHLVLSPDEQWLYFVLATSDADLWLAELR